MFDCHCHFVTLEDFDLYKKTSPAKKILNIRSINYSSLTSQYDFVTFKNIDNMFFTEAVNLDKLNSEIIRIEESIKNNSKIVGIKIYLGYQHYYANDEKIEVVTKLADKYGISMIFHCGETYSPNDSCDNLDEFADAKYIEELAIKYGNVNFIASHMNWPKFDNVFSLCEKYDNVFTCISGCLDAIDKEKRDNQVTKTINIINEYLIKYPDLKNKLMYGTDFFPEGEAFWDVSDYQRIVENLKLNDKEKDNILYNNIFKAYRKLV